MPYGKRLDVPHVTRVPIKRLDSTGEISSESPSMIEVGSKVNNDSTFSLNRANLKNMIGKKSLNSIQSNMTANDSSSSFPLIKDLINMQPIETSKSMVDQKDKNKLTVKDNRYKQAPVSWSQMMTTTFHPAVMATTLVSGVSCAPTSSVNQSHQSYIPKMTYCNLNRCYQNKFRQKFFKGMSCNSGGANRQRYVNPNQQKRHCEKTLKNISEEKRCASSPKNDIVKTGIPEESTAVPEKKSCASSPENTIVQTTLPEEIAAVSEKSEPSSDVEGLEEKCDTHDILTVVNHWSDLCSDNEEVPDSWEEQEENELESNFRKHINNEHPDQLQNDKEDGIQSIIAQVKMQETDNDSLREHTGEKLNCGSFIAQMQVQTDENPLENGISDIAFCDIKMAADNTRTESCADSVDSAHFQIKINSFHPENDDKSSDSQEKEKNDKSFILFIRKDNKKKSKRRRRSKVKKSEENSDSEEPQTKPSSPKCQNSAIAFMFGLSPKKEDNQARKPFYISFDDSSEYSDFSEEDDEAFDEGNFSDSEIADEFHMPLNLSVICQGKPIQNEECSEELKEVNLRWQIQISQKPSTCSLDAEKSDRNGKKVHFAEESSLNQVYEEKDWAEEYQEARKGKWYEYALDRERFQKRIAEVEEILSPVLSVEHRLKVFERLTES